jgi:hypothetical protein
MNELWKNQDHLKEYYEKLILIEWDKTLKNYRLKYWEIETQRFNSILACYKYITESKWTIKEFFETKLKNRKLRQQRKPRLKTNRKRISPKEKKENVEFYSWYIRSEKRNNLRIEYLTKYNNICQCCWFKFINSKLRLHHHTYDRVWDERENDLVLVCEQCHEEIHTKDWKKVPMKEYYLRKRFNQLQKIKKVLPF